MPIFVVHKHSAHKLHWDLRIEIDGVLKSWAVPKEPPREKGVKRLAIQVEDHALSYADFGGVIPKGFYGAGTVEIWDKGECELTEVKEGKLVFILSGRKLKGKYCLIKFKTKEGKDNWLFFKVSA